MDTRIQPRIGVACKELSYDYLFLNPTFMLETLPMRRNSLDIPSRDMTASELIKNRLRLSAPNRLHTIGDLPDNQKNPYGEIQKEWLQRMKQKGNAHSLVAAQEHGPHIGCPISHEAFSSLHRLL